MFRVTLPVIAAVASLAMVGTANAQCCGGPGLFTSGTAWGGGGWGAGVGVGFGAGWGGGCCVAPPTFVASPVFVQAAPVVVQGPPVVVQQPVVVRQPVMVQHPVVVQPRPVVQQYVVNQGPVLSGPGIARATNWYHPPRAIGRYPYVGTRWGVSHHRAAWGTRTHWNSHRGHWNSNRTHWRSHRW